MGGASSKADPLELRGLQVEDMTQGMPPAGRHVLPGVRGREERDPARAAGDKRPSRGWRGALRGSYGLRGGQRLPGRGGAALGYCRVESRVLILAGGEEEGGRG